MLGSLTKICDRAGALARSLEWLGPLLVRLTLGIVFATTGWGKLHNLANVEAFFGSLHIPAPGFHAAVVSTIEFVGGLLLIAGLGTRIVAMLLVGVMAVAIYTAKLPELHGVTDLAGTIEFAYLVMFVWLVAAGAGAVSLDRALDRLVRARRGPATVPVRDR